MSDRKYFNRNIRDRDLTLQEGTLPRSQLVFIAMKLGTVFTQELRT